MEIEGQAREVVTLTLGENEIIQWNNALNEVCHGFVVENFQAAIGIPREAASHLLDRLHEVIPGVGQDFSLDELLGLRNSHCGAGGIASPRIPCAHGCVCGGEPADAQYPGRAYQADALRQNRLTWRVFPQCVSLPQHISCDEQDVGGPLG
jgi:hypothetical protein